MAIRFLEKLFMAILFALSVFARNFLRENCRIFVCCFDVWARARTLALRLISQQTTY